MLPHLRDPPSRHSAERTVQPPRPGAAVGCNRGFGGLPNYARWFGLWAHVPDRYNSADAAPAASRAQRRASHASGKSAAWMTTAIRVGETTDAETHRQARSSCADKNQYSHPSTVHPPAARAADAN